MKLESGVAKGAVGATLRVDLRSRWRSWVALAVFAGLGGGLALGLFAGAARGDDAYAEFSREMRAADAVIAGRSDFGLVGAVDLSEVAALPQVKTLARADVSLLFTGVTGDGRRIGPVDLFPVMPSDEEIGNRVERWSILEGRRARPDRIDEATASSVLAQELGLHVGSTIRLRFVEASRYQSVAAALLSQFGDRLAGAPGARSSAMKELADGPDVTLRVVGIEASPVEFPPLGADLSPILHLTRAFTQKFGSHVVSSPLGYVRLRSSDAATFDAFAKEIERLAGEEPTSFVQIRSLHMPKVERAIHAQANALRIVVFVVLIALLVVVSQAFLRYSDAEQRDDQMLRTLGMRHRDLVALTALRGAIVGVVAGAIAFGIAVLVSAIMPIGIARGAELNRGIDLDVRVLGFGAIGVVIAVVAARVLAWKYVERRARRPFRLRSKFWRRVDPSALPPAAATGVRFALRPERSGTNVPVWVSVVGVTLSFALLGGLWSFRASLDHLLGTPALYGWNWSVQSGASGWLPDVSSALTPAFVHDPSVAAFAEGTVTQVELGLERVDVLAMRNVVGTLAPSLLEGRLPRRPDEVLAGTTTLAHAGLKIGDIAVLRLGNRAAGLRVVGRGVFPEFGDGGRLGNGLFMTFDAAKRLLPDARRNVFLVRFHDGRDLNADVDHVRRALDPIPTTDSGRPQELEQLSQVGDLPTILGMVVALLAAATLAHTIVVSVRQRRRDIAVLRTLGFVNRQLGLAVMWQTTTLIAIGLAIGLPLGALVGRLAWITFSDRLGAVSEAQVAWLPLALTIPVAIFVGNVIAAIPARIALRQRPAESMRAE